jgi:predicted transposase/invertase (TIGR01784 family)
MYDNICKFLAETFPTEFASWLLNEAIPLTELKPTELSIEPIRADSLTLLQSKQLVLHLEFQTRPDPNLPFRILDYGVRIYRKFPEKQLRQVVIYLLPTDSELVYQNFFSRGKTTHEFEVIRLWQQPPEAFESSIGLLPLTILAKVENRAEKLKQIARQLDRVEDRNLQRNLIASTAVLAGLVLDKEAIQRILRSEIMRESVIYQEILAEGEAKGEARGEARGEVKGEARGEIKGEAKAMRQVAINMLAVEMPIAQIARLTGLTIEEIELIQA